jgi:hypothetical protein
VLGRVDTGSQRRGPRCRIDSGPFVFRARDRLPIDEKRDSVFSLRSTVVRLARGYTGGGTGHDAGRNRLVLQDPTTDIDVVR